MQVSEKQWEHCDMYSMDASKLKKCLQLHTIHVAKASQNDDNMKATKPL